MSKSSKKLSIIVIILLTFTFGFLYNKVTITSFLTDSGFDSSYSGGHSHSSGSSHSRSRSSSSRSSSSRSSSRTSSYSSSSSHKSGGGKANFIMAIIMSIITMAFYILIIVFVCGLGRRRKPVVLQLTLNKNKAWNSDKFSYFIKNISLEKFLFERIADLVQVQYNWMNFDYDKLREQLTDELYNQYEMQLKTLETKGQKNVMRDFKPIDSMVTNVENINGRYTVTMEVIISFIDYIEQNGAPVRGNSRKPITMHYELTYIASSDGIVDKCPKCGAELNDTTSQECPYCRTQIIQESSKWVMSKKKALGQR